MADGSLKFDTKIDTEGFEKGANSLKGQLKNIIASLNKSGTEISRTFNNASSTVMRVENSLRSTEEAMKKLKAEMEAYANKQLPTEEYQEIQKQIDEATAKYNKLIERQEKFIEIGGKTDSKAFKTMQYDLEQLRNTIEYAKGELADLEASGKAFRLGRDTAEFANLQAKYKDLASKADVYRQRLKEVDNQQRKASVSTKKLSNNMKKTARASIPLTRSILKLSNMFKLMVLRTMIRAVINAVREGFQNLAQYSNQANKDMSALATSAQTLKNSFAAAFAPILTAITPALQTLINHLSQALTVMGQFFAVLLTGATTFTKAKDAQVDYAKSIAKMAKEANKALSPIDNLNIVGGNEAGGYAGPLPSEMFEEVAISNKIVEAVARIKASFGDLVGWIKEIFAPVFSSVWDDMAPNVDTLKATIGGMFTDIQSLGVPLISYFNEMFVPALQGIGITMGGLLNGWFESFNMVFADIWNVAIFPLLQNLINTWLPVYTEFITEMVSLLGVFHAEAKEIFDDVWKGAFVPALTLATEAWTDLMDIMKEAWDKWGATVFDNFKEAVKTTSDLMKAQWEKYIKPVWDAFMKTADKLWKNHLAPLLKNIMNFVATLVNGALTIYSKFIAPVVRWFATNFGPPISRVVSYLIKIFGDFAGGIYDAVNRTIDVLKSIINFIVAVFTGDWEKAWQSVQDIFKGIFDGLVTIVKTPINLIIDIINGLIKGITAGINTVIKGINSISFSIPGWVPGIGGKSVGFNLRQMSAPKIPRLATGTVVPANYGEFLAILGDNTREAEVVSPISAMKQAFKEAMTEMGGAGTGTINLNVYLEGRQIHSEVVKQDRQYKKETGKSAFAY